MKIKKEQLAQLNKQRLINKLDHSPLAKMFLETDVNEVDPKFMNTMKLKDLDITYEDLAIKFIAEGLLPKNYFVLA